MTLSSSAMDDDARLGAVLGWKAKHLPKGCRLGWMQVEGFAVSPKLVAWLRRCRPDVVIGFPWSWYWHLGGAGWRMPGDFGFAAMLAPGPGQFGVSIAGCDERQAEMLRQGVQMLHQLVVTGRRGFPEQPRQTVIEPIWRDGGSLAAFECSTGPG